MGANKDLQKDYRFCKYEHFSQRPGKAIFPSLSLLRSSLRDKL